MDTDIKDLRETISGLRDNLDEMLDQIDNFGDLASRTAQKADEIAHALGRRGPALPLGFLGFLTVGTIALAIYSPDTLNRIYGQARYWFDTRGRRWLGMAQEQLGTQRPGRMP